MQPIILMIIVMVAIKKLPPVLRITIPPSIVPVRIAQQRGWTPGSFMNENFNFHAWSKGWGNQNMLNGCAIIDKIGSIKFPLHWNKVFARPIEDSKAFAGKTFMTDELNEWLNQLKKLDKRATLHSEVEIMIAPIQEIFCEYRLFVVDGRIITGSLYKLREQVIYNSILDEDVISFAKELIEQWQPNRAFVLDVAITPNGCKVVEVNNLNSAGFYASNVQKIIEAIEEMKFITKLENNNTLKR